jgi:FkbM family methyltransferase
MATDSSNALPSDFAKRLVIFGAGGLGHRIVRGLRSRAIVPLALCDNNRALWGSEVEGVPVLSPASASAAFPQAVFMVGIWHPSQGEGLLSRMAELRSLGCHEVVSFVSLLWLYPEIFLPNMFWESPQYFRGQTAGIDAARALLDDRGKAELERQVAFRLSGDPRVLGAPEPGAQYFPAGVFSLSEQETFVDCGAYNGDSVRDFLKACGGRFRRVIALEPELQNLEALQASVNLDERLRVYPYAVGARREVLRMSSSGASSAVSATGDTEVESVPLDELLADEQPTYIKMDIEGSEIDALRGAEATIRRCRPKLAVCVYHHPDHLWQIPLLLRELMPHSTLTLRSHMLDGFDTVCYCIPQP